MKLSVIVVGFGDEPVIEACLHSAAGQLGPGDEIILVDNGMTTVPHITGVTLIAPTLNTGFGGGCAEGVRAASGDVLMFVNSDAVLRPGAVSALRTAVADPDVGLAGGVVLIPGDPDTVNSVGLPVHLTGLSWCDGYGERLSADHLRPRRLASVAGALFACRREVWDLLGGMDSSYFLYHEDTDLSLRCHLAGLDVVLCPQAVAVHEYEFSRNPDKMFHLERNRFLTVLGDYPVHLLVRVLPVMVVLEPLYLLIAIRDGWGRDKLRAWRWLVTHRRTVRARRSRVQATVRSPHALDGLLTPVVTQTQLQQPGAMALLNGLLGAYWWAARPRPPARDATGEPQRKVDVVVLRTNPKDSSLARLLTVLVGRYRTRALIWDRTQDYRCPVVSPNLRVVASRRRGEYYRLSTIIRVATLQPWFLWHTIRCRPKLVHAMDLDTGIVGLLAARVLRVPFVYQCLDPYAASLPLGWPRPTARLVHRVENAVIGAADLFVITDRARMSQHVGARPRAVIEMPNIPMRELEPQPWSQSGLLVAYIGSLVPHRALDLLVDTVGSLEGDGVRLVLGGFGVLEDELRTRASRHANIEFLGPVPYDEALGILGRADVLVQLGDPRHPALRWVSPNKVFESMAIGRPVIVAEGTLAAERANEAGHGVTVPFGDADALRRALVGLRDDVDARQQLGARGRAAAESRWSPALVTAAMRATYDQLLRRGDTG